VTDGGDSSDDGDATDGRLAVAAIHADAAGDDHENLVDEYVVFENVGAADLDLGGWTVRDADGATYTFPAGASLAPGYRVTVHTGAGTDTSTDRYWDYGRAVWNNGGDTVTVRDGTGTTVLEVTYGDD
jgi:competence protein ComEC